MGVRRTLALLSLALLALAPLAAGGSREQPDPAPGTVVPVVDQPESEDSPDGRPPAEPLPDDPTAPPENEPPVDPAPEDPITPPADEPPVDIEPPAEPLPEDPTAPPEDEPPVDTAPDDPTAPPTDEPPVDIEPPAEPLPEDPTAPPADEPPIGTEPEVRDDPTIVVRQETTVQVIERHERTTIAHELFGSEIAEMMEREPYVAVFVPADEALEDIDRGELTEEERRELSERHVATRVDDGPIEEADSFVTAGGQTVTVTREADGTLLLNGRIVVIETVRTQDGVVYVIDRTIDETRGEDVAEQSALDVIAGHDMTSAAYVLFGEEFARALDERARVAFFVPADEAMADLDPDALTNDEVEALAERHVAIGAVSAEPIESVESFVTTDGQVITVFVESDGTVILNSSVVVIEVIQAFDGYVYIIDGLLDDGEIVS